MNGTALTNAFALAVSLEGIVTFIVYLLIAVVVLGLVWFLINYVEAQCAKFNLNAPLVFAVIRVIFVVLIVLLCIALLMSLAGHPIIEFK